MTDQLYRVGPDGPVVRIAGESLHKGKAHCVVMVPGAYCYQRWGVGTILIPHPAMAELRAMNETGEQQAPCAKGR